MERSMDSDCIKTPNGSTLDTSITIRFISKGKLLIITVNHIKETLKIVKNMDMEFIRGQTNRDTKVGIRRI